MSAHTLIYDIETAPIIGYTWGTYQQDVIRVIEDWYMLSFAFKWLGGKQTFVYALPDFAEYKKNPKNDYYLVEKLHSLFDMADIVVAHNAKKFDNKKSQARFIYHGFDQPAKYATIDTLTEARKHFSFTSNRLDELGKHLGVGRKAETGGFDLWEGCLNGDMKSWKKMKKYNKQDVILLEDVYLKIRPWITNHPSIALLDNNKAACPTCGMENSLEKRGKVPVGKVSWKQRYVCTNCRANVYGRPTERTETMYTS